MFYTAYFRDGAPAAGRPITFLFNGGPGSSTMWLHMGAFGPVRVLTADVAILRRRLTDRQQRAEPARSSRPGVHRRAGHRLQPVAGKDKEKAFYGVDQDIDAFTEFITVFLSKYGRWNSPKYLFGESYGTMRAAGLARAAERGRRSQRRHPPVATSLTGTSCQTIRSSTRASTCPISSRLPTYAATAWYHNRVAGRTATTRSSRSRNSSRPANMREALIKGNNLSDEERQRIARQLSAYTGLPCLSPQDQPPHRVRRVPEGAAGRPGADGRDARHPLRRRDPRSAQQGREL